MILTAYKKGLKKGETCLYKPEAVGQKKTWKIEDLKAHVLVTHILQDPVSKYLCHTLIGIVELSLKMKKQ